MRDPTDLAAQERENAQRAEQDQRRQAQQVEDFKWLMKHEQGRRLMWRWLEFTGVFRTSMTGNSWTFHNEGQRNVGLMLIDSINEHTPDAYVQMLKECKAK